NSDNRHNSVIVVSTVCQFHRLNAFWHLQTRQVDGIANIQSGHIHFNELRQITGSTQYVDAGQVVSNLATAGFHAHAVVFVDEVQRDVRFDLGGFVHAQEVSVPYHWFGRVTLQILQHNLFGFVTDGQGDDAVVERFVFQGFVQLVHFQSDGNRLAVVTTGFTTVNYGRYAIFATQAAARTFPFVFAKYCRQSKF